MTGLNKIEEYLISMLASLGVSKTTTIGITCLLTEQEQNKMIEKLIDMYNDKQEITEQEAIKMAMEVAGIQTTK